MSAQIADFNIRFNADSAKFHKDVDYAKKMLRGYTKEAKAANDSTGNFDQQLKVAGTSFKEFGSMALQVTGMVTAGFGAAVTASAYLVRQSAQQAREIERQATIAQVSVERIQELSYASEQYGIAGDKMADILKDVNDKLGDFTSEKSGEFASFFEQVAPKVGVTADELARLSSPEILVRVKEAMDQANVPMKEQLKYLEQIADEASALMPLLENKGERLYELTDHYQNLNVAMSQYDIQQFKKMDQQISDMEMKMGRAFGNLSRQVTYSLLPAMDDVNEFVDAMTKGVKNYTNQIEAFGMATATLNVFSGTSMREKHREIFGEMIELEEELKEYKGVDINKLPSINPFGKSRNEWFNLQRDLGMKRDELKALNDKVVEQQKRWSSNFDYTELGGNGANDDDGGSGTDSKELERQQAAGASRLSALDMQYASEREKLKLAHDQRLVDIEELQLSEQELARRGYETLDALKAEYKAREDEFYIVEQEENQRRQDEAIQREIDAFARKEEEKNRKAEQAARQRAETEKRIEQQVVGMKMQFATQTLGLIEQTAKEGSAIQKAAFLAQKVMAAMQVVQQGEVAAMAAMSMPPIGLGPIAGAGMAATIRMMSAASAGMIMGQAIAGMAHNGIGEIPAEGTWLLDKGERVYTNYSAQQIDQMYNAVMAMYRQPFAANDPSYRMAKDVAGMRASGTQVNIFGAPEGTRVEKEQGQDGEEIVNVFLADLDADGPMSQGIARTFGTARQGV